MSIVDTLRNIAAKAQQLYSLIGPPRPPKAGSYIPIPPLTLPLPYDVLDAIDQLPLPFDKREAVKSKLSERIFSSQRLYVDSYERMCRKLASTIDASDTIPQLGKIYENSYTQRHLQGLRDIIEKLRQAPTSAASRKPIFNTKFTPVLEEYFLTNAYPSISQRRALASATNMTERQIEVWFQNHRNRAKKDGRPLRRSTRPLPCSPLILTHEKSHTMSVQTGSQDLCDHPPPPQSAFPAPFDPNFIPQLIQFAVPTRPVARQKPQQPVDVDELTLMFNEKLNLSTDAPRRRRSKETTSEAWCSARVARPPSAPHPALVKPITLNEFCTQARPTAKPAPSFATVSLKPGKPVYRTRHTSTDFATFVTPSTLGTFGSRTPSLSSVSSVDTSLADPLPLTPPTFAVDHGWMYDDINFNTWFNNIFSEPFDLEDSITSAITLDLDFNNLAQLNPQALQIPTPHVCEAPFSFSLPSLNMNLLPC